MRTIVHCLSFLREKVYTNWIGKYFRRGKALEDITPSHMVKMFDPARTAKGKSDIDIKDNEEEYEEEKYDQITNDDSDIFKKYGKDEKYHHFIIKKGLIGKILPNIVE